jgi:protein SCO1/2
MTPIRIRIPLFLAALLVALSPSFALAGVAGDPPPCHGEGAVAPQPENDTAPADAVHHEPAAAEHSMPADHSMHMAHGEHPAAAGDEHAAHRAQLAAAEHSQDATQAEVIATDGLDIPDFELLDQDGDTLHFYSDLVEGRRVAINFVFTTCTTICPPMGANFAKLQQLLGDTDVELISVSVDPMTDTPDRLKAWAARFGAQPGWTLVTGEKSRIDSLLKALKVFTPDAEDHSPIVLVGNDANGRWQRAYGLAPADRLEALLAQLATDEDTTTFTATGGQH